MLILFHFTSGLFHFASLLLCFTSLLLHFICLLVLCHFTSLLLHCAPLPLKSHSYGLFSLLGFHGISRLQSLWRALDLHVLPRSLCGVVTGVAALKSRIPGNHHGLGHDYSSMILTCRLIKSQMRKSFTVCETVILSFVFYFQMTSCFRKIMKPTAKMNTRVPAEKKI